MDGDLSGLLAGARDALAGGDWAAARASFEHAVPRDPSGAALDGLAQALSAQGDYAAAITTAERAFAAYEADGQDVRAAACARFVGYLYGAVHGNGAAAGGWLGRAVRLIDAVGDCPERARIELTRAVLTADPDDRERHLATALRIARAHGDRDLVLDALSQRGLHLVAAGDVAAGMALLDESLAAVAAGEVANLVSVGAMYCKMLHACELTCDVRRAEEWLALADGFVARTNRLPISAICRTHYGGVLTAAGRWADAERELVDSIALYDRTFRALRGAAVVRLAALRVRQGRLAEAGELLAGAEHDAYAIRPLAELHLARGEPALAAARIERHLRTGPATDLAAPLHVLLVQAELAQGHHDLAEAAVARLAGITANPLLTAYLEHARGLVAAEPAGHLAAGQAGHLAAEPSGHLAAEHGRGLVAAEPAGHLEAALAGFARLSLPLEEARVRLDLARVLAAASPDMALAEARPRTPASGTCPPAATPTPRPRCCVSWACAATAARGARGRSPPGSGRCWSCSARACPTPTSPPACSSAAARPSTMCRTSSPSWA